MTVPTDAQRIGTPVIEGAEGDVLQRGPDCRCAGHRIKYPHGADLFFVSNRVRARVGAGQRPFAAIVFAKQRAVGGRREWVPVRVAYFGTSRKAREAALAWWRAEQAALTLALRSSLAASVPIRRGALVVPFPVLFVPKPARQASLSASEPVQAPVPDEVEELAAVSVEDADAPADVAVATAEEAAVIDEVVVPAALSSWLERFVGWLSRVWRRARSRGRAADFSVRSMGKSSEGSR